MRHIHDCDKCEYIGSIEGTGDWSEQYYDLYVCEETLFSDTCGPSFIARYGSEGHEYVSMDSRTLEMMKSADNYDAERYEHYPVMIAKNVWEGRR